MSQLDSKMSKDLNELYHQGQISDAVSLDNAGIICSPFSTKGKPGYYTGNRNANTVVVALNPGIESSEADNNYSNAILPAQKWHSNQSSKWNDFSSYYNSFMDLSDNAGTYDINRLDYFDLKPAAFLKEWPECGINIPNAFPEKKDTYLAAKAAAMNEKLQLELIPYASQKFRIKKGADYRFLFPYLEMVFNEIISEERSFVIFAAGVFESIFKAYNQDSTTNGVIDLSNPVQKTADPLKKGGRIKGRCRVIHITYKGNSFKAIIAHSYASYALHYAIYRMRDYGRFCYDVFKKTP